MAEARSPGRAAADSSSPVNDRIEELARMATYWLVVASVYITFGFLWYHSFKEKLFDDGGTMPEPLKEDFAGSFLDSVPGLDASWMLLGILEGVVFAAVIASLLNLEFLPGRRKPLLVLSVGLSMVTFGFMLFAQTMVAQFDSVAQLFGYFAGSAVILILIFLMPPHRSLGQQVKSPPQ